MFKYMHAEPYVEPVTDEDVYIMGFLTIGPVGLVYPPDITETVDFPPGLPCTYDEAEWAFKQAGWRGVGSLGLIWLPPFLFLKDEHGVLLWHVRDNQEISWICAKGVVPILNEHSCNLPWRGINLAPFREKDDDAEVHSVQE
jgi:hypothetical protein